MTTTRKRTIRASFALRPAFDRRYQYQVSHVRSRRIIRVHPRSPRSKTSHRGWSAQKAKRASSSGSSCAFRQVFGPFGGPRSPLAPPGRHPTLTPAARARPVAHSRVHRAHARSPAPPLATMAATPSRPRDPSRRAAFPPTRPPPRSSAAVAARPRAGSAPSRRRPAPPRAPPPPPARPRPRPRRGRAAGSAGVSSRPTTPTRSPAAARGGTRWSCTP